MQYVEIVVNSKTKKIDQKFTYLIKPDQLPDIKPGILILVPFGNKKIEGVVWSIKKHERDDIKVKLKPIIKILDKNIVLDKTRRRLAEMISNYYLASIGEVVFFMIPPIAKRIKIPRLEIINNIPDKTGEIYTLYDRYENRVKDYIKLTKKALKSKKQVLLLIPELIKNDYLINKFISEYKDKILIYDTSKTITQRYQDWLKIRAGKHQIVIGTRSSIFSPLNNLGLIIIDQHHHFAYKEEQSPHYNSVKVAQWFIKLTNVNLILGDICSSVNNKYYLGQKKYRSIKSTNLSGLLQNINIELVDQSKEKSIISWQLEKAIKRTLDSNQKIILYTTRKGFGSVIICKNCKYEFKCSQCNLPLIEHEHTKLVCHHCNKKFKIPATCPKCRGTNLISLGVGIDKVFSVIKKLFPTAKILKIEKNSNKQQATSNKQYNIILGTKKIFSYHKINADLVGIINIDNILNLPDYKSEENTYFTLVELINRTKNKLIIQTYNLEKNFYQYFTNNQLDQFLSDELKLRKKHNYPPFSRLIKITYQHYDKFKAKKEIDKIYKMLQATSYKLQADLIGPIPCFIEKIRGKYRYQIIIKLSVNSYQLSEIKKIVESFPHGTSVDVDPLSLL